MDVATCSFEARLRRAVTERLGSTRADLWFSEPVGFGLDGESLEVTVPSTFSRDWIEAHYRTDLIQAAEIVAGRRLDLRFRIEGELGPKIGTVVNPPEPGDHRAGSSPIAAPVRAHDLQSDPRSWGSMTLENFVAGPGSQLAYTAAREVVRTAGAAFNPLFVHGSTGIGKTHLLAGIGHALQMERPAQTVLRLTAEAFTNSFLDAMRSSTLAAFRARHRKAGAFIIDDVHFLAAKRATQDEFLHTFDALLAIGAPVVLAAHAHPRQISRLADELVTRFVAGLVVRVEPPDFRTRCSILKLKAVALGLELPELVLEYVAEHLRTSVRELEGSLHTLAGHLLASDRPLDLALARVALRETIRYTARSVALHEVERAVCQLFELTADTLKSEQRSRWVAYPRMLAMYLARKYTTATYAEIGRYFGGRNHTTVMAAVKKVTAWLDDEDRIRPLVGFTSVADALERLEQLILASRA